MGTYALAVVLALLWSFIVGFIWYGVLFKNQWSKYTGIKENDKDSKKNMWKYICKNQCFNLLWLIAFAFIVFAGGPEKLDQIIVLVLLLWLAFTVPAVMAPNIWEKKPFGLGMINIFAYLAQSLVAGIILMKVMM